MQRKAVDEILYWVAVIAGCALILSGMIVAAINLIHGTTVVS